MVAVVQRQLEARILRSNNKIQPLIKLGNNFHRKLKEKRTRDIIIGRIIFFQNKHLSIIRIIACNEECIE